MLSRCARTCAVLGLVVGSRDSQAGAMECCTEGGVESITSPFIIVGVVQQQGYGHLTPRATTHGGSRSFHAAFAIAAQVLHIRYVSTIRVCRGAIILPALKGYVHSEVLLWRRDGDVSEVTHFSTEGAELIRPFPAKSLASEIQEANEASIAWQEVCFVQFFSVGCNRVQRVIRVAPDVLLFAGAGCRQPHRTGELRSFVLDGVVDSSRPAAAPCLERERRLEVSFWLPTFAATKVNDLDDKTPLARPSECVFIWALLEKHASATNTTTLRHIANTTPANMNFGSRFGVSSIQVEPGSPARSKEENEEEDEWPGGWWTSESQSGCQ